MPDDDLLVHVLTEIRRRGGIGTQPVDDALAHSERFVAAVPPACSVGADLGSGGGLPGLVLAVRCPDMQWHLVERRATRADLLRFGVRTLGLDDRVVVHAEDLRAFATHRLPVDVVTARSFSSLPVTLTSAASVLTSRTGADSDAWVLISEPPNGMAAGRALLDRLRLHDDGSHDGVRRFAMFHVERSAPPPR